MQGAICLPLPPPQLLLKGANLTIVESTIVKFIPFSSLDHTHFLTFEGKHYKLDHVLIAV